MTREERYVHYESAMRRLEALLEGQKVWQKALVEASTVAMTKDQRTATATMMSMTNLAIDQITLAIQDLKKI